MIFLLIFHSIFHSISLSIYNFIIVLTFLLIFSRSFLDLPIPYKYKSPAIFLLFDNISFQSPSVASIIFSITLLIAHSITLTITLKITLTITFYVTFSVTLSITLFITLFITLSIILSITLLIAFMILPLILFKITFMIFILISHSMLESSFNQPIYTFLFFNLYLVFSSTSPNSSAPCLDHLPSLVIASVSQSFAVASLLSSSSLGSNSTCEVSMS